jgi:hypothetical protein
MQEVVEGNNTINEVGGSDQNKIRQVSNGNFALAQSQNDSRAKTCAGLVCTFGIGVWYLALVLFGAKISFVVCTHSIRHS